MGIAFCFTVMNSVSEPVVSILLSVYNGEAALNRALQSIAEQTYKNWELICIDDGSTDATDAIISKWRTTIGVNRIHCIQHQQNQGLTISLNDGLRLATGKYIARLDHDDRWDSTKLAKQVSSLEANARIGVMGTWYSNVIAGKVRTIPLPVTDVRIRKMIFKKNPFGHSCVMIRHKLLTKVGGYNTQLRYAQDRDLWFRLLPHTKFANIPECLVTRQIDPQKSSTNKTDQIASSLRVTMGYIHKYRAPLYTYLFLIEPAAAYIAPHWLRRFVRTYL